MNSTRQELSKVRIVNYGGNGQDDGVPKDVCVADPDPDRVSHGKLHFALVIEVRGRDLVFLKSWYDRCVDFGLKKIAHSFYRKNLGVPDCIRYGKLDP